MNFIQEYGSITFSVTSTFTYNVIIYFKAVYVSWIFNFIFLHFNVCLRMAIVSLKHAEQFNYTGDLRLHTNGLHFLV